MSSERSEEPRYKIYEIPRFSRCDAEYRIASLTLFTRNDIRVGMSPYLRNRVLSACHQIHMNI
jgi:hypothetical protein